MNNKGGVCSDSCHVSLFNPRWGPALLVTILLAVRNAIATFSTSAPSP